MMSFIVGLILIAIAWFFSALINGMLETWHLFDRLPLWLMGVVLASAIAYFVSEP